MPKPETLLRSRIIARLRRDRPGYWRVTHGSAMQAVGRPDIEGCYEGRFYGLEVKRPENKRGLTVKQAHVIEEIIRAGGIAGVISSVDEALAFVPNRRKVE